jgi:hypothetical protein
VAPPPPPGGVAPFRRAVDTLVELAEQADDAGVSRAGLSLIGGRSVQRGLRRAAVDGGVRIRRGLYYRFILRWRNGEAINDPDTVNP